MKSIMHRDPFADPLTPMFNRMLRLFNEPFFTEGEEMVPTVDEGALALDVFEDQQNVIVRASLPGFRKDEVEVEVAEGVLSIKAEHREEHEETGEKWYRKERRFGSLSRRVALPCPVLDDQSKAELKEGVLTLRLPKSPEAQARKIKIS